MSEKKERYAGLDGDAKVAYLETLLGEMMPAEIVNIPGVVEVLLEELNNDILAAWEEDHPEDSDEFWEEQ